MIEDALDNLGGRRGAVHGHIPQGSAEKEIIRRIRAKGPLTFAEFMDVALYWHDAGYYTGKKNVWGPEGDYITNMDVSPVFARLVARQIHGCWETLGRPRVFELVEAGAGRGLLSKGILDFLQTDSPELFDVVKVVLVEKNPGLGGRESQKISFHRDITGIASGIIGCILSNELIDSFPFHRVVERQGLKELYVDFDDRGFSYREGAPSTPLLEAYLKRLCVELSEGQIAHINLNATEWVRQAGEILKKGFVITIDYGLPARELYSQGRQSIVQCHFRHRVNNDPFANIGFQDITSNVDFTALKAFGEDAGLGLTGFATQKNFLMGMGIVDEFGGIEDAGIENSLKLRYNESVKALFMPGGMGDIFKVLVQHKGIGTRPMLKGFSFKDQSLNLK